MTITSKENPIMKNNSKIKLTEDDFVLVGMNYNYYMIPRLAYTENDLKKLKQQILRNQEMIEELEEIWNDNTNLIVTDKVTEIMEKYLGKRS